MQSLTARDSPSSKPPPDKRISNEEPTPTSVKTPVGASLSDQPKTKVVEAPVLPSPPPNQPNKPQELPQPPPSQPTSREALAQRAIPKPSSSKQLQTEPTIGYQGTPQAQRTVQDIMGDYPDRKVTNSGPTDTPLRKQANGKNVHKTVNLPEPDAEHQGQFGYQGRQTHLGFSGLRVTGMAV